MKYFIYILIAIASVACQPKKLEKDELNAWLRNPKNGCNKVKSIGPWEIQMTYRPSDLVAWQIFEAESKIGPVAEEYLDSLKVDLAQYNYFTLQISAEGKEAEAYQATPAIFSERVQTFSFGMKPLVSAIYDQQDTVEAIHYSYDRTFGMTHATNFLFVFDKKETPDIRKVQLYVQDPGLGFGSQKFTFSLADLRKSRDKFLH